MKNRIAKFIVRNAPELLSLVASAGVIATGYLAIKATEKAEATVREDEISDPVVKAVATYRYYIPAALVGAGTILCIVESNVLSRKQQMRILAAYEGLSGFYKAYSEEVKQRYGEEVHKEIVAKIEAEHVDENRCLYARGYMGSTTTDFGTKGQELLFYEPFTKRYYYATESQVLQAQYHFNRNFVLGGHGSLGDYHELLGIEALKEEYNIGWEIVDWMYWIDFDNSKGVTPDGISCFITGFDVDPMTEREWFDD